MDCFVYKFGLKILILEISPRILIYQSCLKLFKSQSSGRNKKSIQNPAFISRLTTNNKCYDYSDPDSDSRNENFYVGAKYFYIKWRDNLFNL